MVVLILHNKVSADASEAERDVLVQVEAVTRALQELGHQIETLPCTLDLGVVRSALTTRKVDYVFNLVESLGNSDWLMYLVPALLDTLGVPYSGASTTAIFRTTHKLLAKREMTAVGIPTPYWFTDDRSVAAINQTELNWTTPKKFIVKSICEHASLGLDDEAVVDVQDQQSLSAAVQRFRTRTGKNGFAEEFIDGREFNLSLLGERGGPIVLPPAEIEFIDFPEDKPRIVGFDAKWNEQSTAYHQTPRRFDFPESDTQLLQGLRDIAIQCWEVFGLTGYARVDFRVDARNNPWVLEVNANPCLSPDAGFAFALARAGIPFTEAIRKITQNGLAHLSAT